MEFERPIFLLGLAAALIPLLVHLFDRRKARPLRFAAMDFVLRSRKRAASRLRLRRIVLYTLRTLLFLAIPLALAKPHRATAHALALAPRGPAATAIVLDASLSMRAVHEGKSLFESAQALARDALATLGPEEPVTVLVCGASPIKSPRAPSFDRAGARRLIDEARAGFAPSDGNACLQAAAAALADSPIASKRIFFASDLTVGALRMDVPGPRIAGPKGEVKPEVVLLDAARGATLLPNAGISELHIEPEPSLGSRGYGFTFTVHNHGAKPLRDLAVSLEVEGHIVAKGGLDLPAHGSARKTLSYRFPAGGELHGAVKLAADALAEDDARAFTLRVPKELRALIVDGAPSTVRFLDEAFFLEAALTASGSPVHATTVDVDTFDQRPLEPGAFDVVLLVDVPLLDPARVKELTGFVEGGGGLFVSLGAQVDPDAYDARMAQLLPRPLRLVKTAAVPGAPGSEERAARFSQVLWSHPAFSVFAGDAREGFTSARTYKYFLLEPGDASAFTVLASYDDGAPALVLAQRGKGRIILDTSTVDRSWSDFAIRTAFLPLMQRLTSYLAGALDEHVVQSGKVGEPHPLGEVPAGKVSVRGPDGKPRALLAAQPGQPAQVLQTELPGLYTVSVDDGSGAKGASGLDFAVNVDPSESDLTRLDPGELVGYFGEGTKTQTGGAPTAPRSHLPLWTGLLALAVAIFFFEGAVLSRP